MAFTPYKKTPDDFDLMLFPLGASLTCYVGDVLAIGGTGHNKALVTGVSLSTTPVYGVLMGIRGAEGQVLELDSVTTGAGNETTTVYYGLVCPAYLPIKWTATLSATAGTTTGSDGACFFATGSTHGQLDETSVAFIAGTKKVFWSDGLDTRDTTNKTVIGYFAITTK